MSTITKPALRSDVARVVEQCAAVAVLGGSDNEWRDYESAKRAISAVCGWDAPGCYDPIQYDMAIEAYCTLAGL